MSESPAVVAELADRLRELGWITELWVGGSLATGDYTPGISDLDLVAVVDGPVGSSRRTTLSDLHRELDAGTGTGLKTGCVYVDRASVRDRTATHPTWTHGSMADRILSSVARAELVLHGYAVLGGPPRDVLPEMSDDDIRDAARAELCGYWAWAAGRPWLWLDPVIADLGLTSMARGRHTLASGELLTKSAAIDQANAPAWLVEQLRARRRGEDVTSPRFRTAVIAWCDAWRTVAAARK